LVFVAAAAAIVYAGGDAAANAPTSALPEKGRAIFEKNKSAVLWVTAVLKVEMSGGGKTFPTREVNVQALGTVVDTSGLTVVSLSALDPSAASDGQVVQGVKLTVSSEFDKVRINLPTGEEIPARVVMKDKDTDLAFVMPDADAKEKPAKFDCLTFATTPKVQVLDELVCIGRENKALGQAPMASTSEVSAVVTTPRKFVLGGRYVGGPVFLADGSLIGITVVHRAESGGNPSIVILPAEDVAAVAQQAKEQAKAAPTTKPATTEGTTPEPSPATPAPAPATKPASE
jgi:hypothetical protein